MPAMDGRTFFLTDINATPMRKKIKSVSSKTLEMLYFLFVCIPVFLLVWAAVQTFFLIKSIIKWTTKK